MKKSIYFSLILILKGIIGFTFLSSSTYEAKSHANQERIAIRAENSNNNFFGYGELIVNGFNRFISEDYTYYLKNTENRKTVEVRTWY